MLSIKIPDSEFFDNETQTFIPIKGREIVLEHSLVSLAKWEARWNVPFLSNKHEKTQEMAIDYVRCMTISQNVDPLLYYMISKEQIEEIRKYIDAPMTATWFSEDKKSAPNREIITAEIIYYWMIAQNIPVEFQKWHLNRLITLIRVCSIKNTPPKKMSSKDWASQRRALNAARRGRR